MKQKRAYKYRWYPTAEQQQILARTFGCARFIYNWALRLRTDAYYQHQQRITYYGTSARLTALKQQPEYCWLNDVASVPLQQALRHVESAFRNFFAGRAAYPTFRSKHGPQSATYIGTAFRWNGTTLTLAKMDEPLDIVWSRPLPKGCTPIASFVRTKPSASRACKSSTWSKITVWPRPSVMSAGVSSSANWSTKPGGTGGCLSKLTSSIRHRSDVPTVDMCLTPLIWRHGSGCVPSVTPFMTATSMPRKTCWPQGLRCQPVERL